MTAQTDLEGLARARQPGVPNLLVASRSRTPSPPGRDSATIAGWRTTAPGFATAEPGTLARCRRPAVDPEKLSNGIQSAKTAQTGRRENDRIQLGP